MRKRYFAASLAGLAVVAGAFLSAGMSAGVASAAAANGCPASKTGVPVDSNVTASVSTAGNTSTYTFSSTASENPSGGVPGLIKYCVSTRDVRHGRLLLARKWHMSVAREN